MNTDGARTGEAEAAPADHRAPRADAPDPPPDHPARQIDHPVPQAAPSTPPAGSGSTVRYVYAVCRAGTAVDAAAGRIAGLEGGPVRTVVGGGLAALVSSVPAGAYDEEGMRTRLENLSELAALARTHHAVIDAASRMTEVLPLRLATVYLDDAGVRSMLREQGADFGARLARVEGHVELGVKVYADPREAAAPPAAPGAAAGAGVAGEGAGVRGSAPAPGSAPAGPGRAYLQRRRAQRQQHREAYRAAGAVAGEVPGRVAALVRARVVHRPQRGELAATAGENIANEAYLVPTGRIGEFHQALSGMADGVPGVRVEITGPWAPYSFATPLAVDGGA
ncbi:GvpL/GvpF family gas vesicle protein [Streptomyces sp. NPDC056411]|uniref:GvpL/GvpF family gas vesicle protein n=1 Tax=Streptomyces sp. NPDC056411 TaxID=3345813 RepID=UPI0035D62A4A